MVWGGGGETYAGGGYRLVAMAGLSETRKPIRLCRHCHGAYAPSLTGTGKYCSIECSVAELVAYNRELRERRGDRYAKWVKAYLEAAERLSAEGG